MKKLNVYDVYLDDGRDTFKCTIPAENKAAAKSTSPEMARSSQSGIAIYRTSTQIFWPTHSAGTAGAKKKLT